MRVPVGEVLPRCQPVDRGPVVDRWVQVGLAPPGGPPRALFGELAALVRDWRARRVIEDFFFMNKPPGIRVRFAPAPGQAPFVRAELRRLVGSWCATGLVNGIEPGVYEPEEDRFGGPEPMDHAHRMFTVDAATWLEFHARPRRTPGWALSFAMLRPVFAAMDVDGGREHAVWAQVAAAGRLVPSGVTSPGALGDGLRGWWHRPGALSEDDVVELAAVHASRVTPLAAAWAASLRGPERDRAVAWYVVFHWNRAGLGFGTQALLTEALRAAERSRGDVR